MLKIAVPSILQQSTVSIGMMIVQAVVNPFGTQALAGYAATMRVENVFHWYLYQSEMPCHHLFRKISAPEKLTVLKRLPRRFAVRCMLCRTCICNYWNNAHTNFFTFLRKRRNGISVSSVRWLYEMDWILFHIYGYQNGNRRCSSRTWKYAPVFDCKYGQPCDSVIRSIDFAPHFGIAFVWLAVPAGWLANFVISYAALRKSWPKNALDQEIHHI